MSKCGVGMKLFLRGVEQNASRMEAGQGGFGRQENMAPECEPDPGRIQPDLSRIREATPEDDPWPGRIREATPEYGLWPARIREATPEYGPWPAWTREDLT